MKALAVISNGFSIIADSFMGIFFGNKVKGAELDITDGGFAQDWKNLVSDFNNIASDFRKATDLVTSANGK